MGSVGRRVAYLRVLESMRPVRIDTFFYGQNCFSKCVAELDRGFVRILISIIKINDKCRIIASKYLDTVLSILLPGHQVLGVEGLTDTPQ